MSGKAGGADAAGITAEPGPTAVAAVNIKREEEQHEQILSRTKRGGAKKKPAGGARASASGALGGYQQPLPEPLALNPQQGEFVRVVKVDTRKAAAEAGEDPSRVQLSRTGKATQLTLSEDRMSVTGTKGFRTSRASHGAHVGTWYCEARVTRLGATGHARLGWVTRKAELQAPVGFDQFGYAYRDLEGTRVHQGRREPYGEAFAEGDIIGMLLHMPAGGKPMEAQDRSVVRFKGALYYVDEPEPKPQPLPGSLVAFSRNGVPQGVAFRDLLEGTYYPAAALYTLPEQTDGAMVTFNFGPDFAFAPPPVPEVCSAARPIFELVLPAAPPAPTVVPAVVPPAPAAQVAASAPAGDEYGALTAAAAVVAPATAVAEEGGRLGASVAVVAGVVLAEATQQPSVV